MSQARADIQKLFADYGARVIKVERPVSATAPLNSSNSDPPSPKSETGPGGESPRHGSCGFS